MGQNARQFARFFREFGIEDDLSFSNESCGVYGVAVCIPRIELAPPGRQRHQEANANRAACDLRQAFEQRVNGLSAVGAAAEA